MSRRYKVLAVAGLAVLMLSLLFAGQALAQRGTPVPGGMMSGNAGMMSSGTVTPTVSGRNMMGSAAGPMLGSSPSVTGTLPLWMQQMMGSSTGVTGTLPLWMQQMMGAYGASSMMGNGAFGNGMMGSGAFGNGMMGGGMMGNGMMGGWSDPNAKPLTLDQAQAAAQKYIQSLPNNAGSALAPMEVMEFANGFYVAVGDKSGGAFEVLVDRYTGNVTPEPGPNMMWNTKFGMMTGQQGDMMGMMGLWAPPAGTPSVSEQQARANAQKFLDLKFPGAKLPQDTMSFPGYYTIDFEINGQPAGMLSVNAFSGQVWYHTWHSQFLSESAAK
jgi:hypothetical protein